MQEVAIRAERVIARVRALEGDVLLFAHGHILRIITARWIDLPALEARRFYISTTSVTILGYDHNLSEPVIHLLNDTRRK